MLHNQTDRFMNQLNSLISSRWLLDEQPIGSKFEFLPENFKKSSTWHTQEEIN